MLEDEQNAVPPAPAGVTIPPDEAARVQALVAREMANYQHNEAQFRLRTMMPEINDLRRRLGFRACPNCKALTVK